MSILPGPLDADAGPLDGGSRDPAASASAERDDETRVLSWLDRLEKTLETRVEAARGDAEAARVLQDFALSLAAEFPAGSVERQRAERLREELDLRLRGLNARAPSPERSPELSRRLGPTQKMPSATLRGRVVSPTGEPILGARVIARSAARDVEGVTNLDGDFTLELPPATYRVIVYALGWEDRTFGGPPCRAGSCPGGTLIELEDGEERAIEVTLRPAASLAGVVVDTAGLPIAGATVTAVQRGDPRLSTQTASDGSWSIDDLQPGLYLVRVSDSRYIDEAFDDIPCQPCAGPVPEEDLVPLEPGESRTDIDFELESLGRVEGRITLAIDGSLVPFAWIDVFDENGNYLFRESVGGEFSLTLEPGRYLLGVEPLAEFVGELYPQIPCIGEPLSGGCPFGEGQVIEIGGEQVIEGVDFSLELGGTISGRVTNGDGEEAFFRKVEVFDSEGRLVGSVDADDVGGAYEVRPLLTDDHRVLARRTVESTFESDAELWDDRPCERCQPLDGDPVWVELGETTRDIDIRFEAQANLEVIVRDAVNGEVLGSPFVAVFTADGLRVDERRVDDTWRLAPGRYYVAAGELRYQNGSWMGPPVPFGIAQDRPEIVDLATPLDLVSGEERTITIDLLPLGGIVGRVVAPDGTPVAGVDVTALDVDSLFATTFEETDADGRFRIDVLSSEELILTAETGELGFVDQLWRSIPCLTVNFGLLTFCDRDAAERVRIDGSADLDLGDWVMIPRSELVVRAEDAVTGRAVESFNFTVFLADGREYVDPRVTDGSRSVPLIEGGYRVLAEAPGYVTSAFGAEACGPGCGVFAGEVIELAAGETREIVVRLFRPPGTGGLVLGDARFQVDVSWTDFDGNRGEGVGVPLSDDSGYFWFFGDDNIELVIKVLDACEAFGRYWVFAAGLTNVEVETEVTDLLDGGATTRYENPLGTPFEPILDVDAFDTCPSGARAGVLAPPSAPPKVGEPLALMDGRFAVATTWRDFDGNEGDGTGVGLTPTTGTFWFFDPANVEVIVKVLDACEAFDRYWVFAAGLTNVDVELTVTDTQATGEGATVIYLNPLGTPFQPILDVDAFATCP